MATTHRDRPVDVLLLAPPRELKSNVAHSAVVIRSAGAYPPLGLAYLAGTLEAEGVRVGLIDLSLYPGSLQALPQRLKRLQPKIVGIGGMTLALEAIAQVVGLVRRSLSDVTVVVGGPCLEDYPREILMRLAEVDLAVVGEGELALRDIVDHRLAGRSTDDIPGTVFRRNGKVVMATARPLVKNLDDLAPPAYHLLDFKDYSPVTSVGRSYATMYSIRGCPYNCRYCHRQHWLTRVRMNSPARVVAEARYLVRERGVEEIKFYDETFTLSRRRTLEICRRMVASGISVPWEIRTRPELLDPELIAALKKAGCQRICLGVEGGSQQRLDRMGRSTRMVDIQRAFAWINRAGLSSLAFFMIGYPGDSREDYEDVLRLAARVSPTWIVVSATTAYPNTSIYRKLIEDGTLTTDIWKEFTLGLRKEIPKYELMFDGRDYSRYELETMAQMAYWRFYLRPRQAVKILREIRSTRQAGNFIKMGLAMAQAAYEARGPAAWARDRA